jgi:hypothetical protein
VATLIPFTFIITHTRVIVRATNLVFVNTRQRAVVRDGVGGIMVAVEGKKAEEMR